MIWTSVRRSNIRDRIIGDLCKLPEAEAVHGGHLSLEIRGKRFAWYLENHHGDSRIPFNCRSEISETLEHVRR